MAGHANSTRAVLFALGANFAIFVAKVVAALLTASGAMLAEAVHSLADCGNQCLLLYGMRRSKTPPSPDFPLGYGKAIYFWSFLVAVMLFSVGGMFSIWEGVHKLQHPEPLSWPWLAVGVLVFAIAVEAVSMAACMREVHIARKHRGIWRWFKETRQSELLVVFGEDAAALFGLVFALLAVLATMVTGNPVWDACGTIGIGVLLILVAVFIAIEVKQLLIGQSVEPDVRSAIRAWLEARPEIARVFHVISLQLGGDVMIAVKAQMARDQPMRAAVDEINRIEAELKREFGEVRWCFFEPDVAD
jgi:cation diffusion facilitator family transporter